MIDYGSGNLRSVEKALQHAGADIVRCESPEPLEGCAAVVLPGVGSFGDCARSLEARGLTSEESPEARGLAHWQGKVVRFPERKDLKVPHMGWNSLEPVGYDPTFDGLSDPAFVYFVHSYYPDPSDQGLVTARSTHGIPFAAACRRGNVRGVQFHPEKSQATGLRMLENFIAEIRTRIH